jgi:hypothetical protein
MVQTVRLTAPQTQGDGSASSPTDLQISKPNMDEPGPPTAPPTSGEFTVNVSKADCDTDFFPSIIVVACSGNITFYHFGEVEGILCAHSPDHDPVTVQHCSMRLPNVEQLVNPICDRGFSSGILTCRLD